MTAQMTVPAREVLRERSKVVVRDCNGSEIDGRIIKVVGR
jgi:hypothetical protein